MDYRKISFPLAAFRRFQDVASLLGYSKRGQKWQLLDMLLDYAELHPNLFRKR